MMSGLKVFANYFAALITEPLFPPSQSPAELDEDLYSRILVEDRTPGTTAIRQPLDNLQNAGLIYGQIIYNKAPVMMVKLGGINGKRSISGRDSRIFKTYAYAKRYLG